MQGSRPVRTAGFVLIGVAVIAVGLGVFTLTSNGSGQASAGHPPVVPSTTTPPPTTTHPTTTTRPPATPTTTRPAPTTTHTVAPTTTVAAPPPPPETTPDLKATVPVRVYNNSMIKNLAADAGTELRAAGYDVVETGNYPNGVIPHSTAYYTSTPGEQQVATELAQQFGIDVAPRFSGIAFASPGVIVILTEDFRSGK